MIPLEHILLVSSAIFGIGVLGIMMADSVLRFLIAVEVLLNASALGFIGCALSYGDMQGYVMFFMILVVASAEVSIGLVILFCCHRWFKTVDLSSIKRLYE